jgi:hypothetical protein
MFVEGESSTEDNPKKFDAPPTQQDVSDAGNIQDLEALEAQGKKLNALIEDKDKSATPDKFELGSILVVIQANTAYQRGEQGFLCSLARMSISKSSAYEYMDLYARASVLGDADRARVLAMSMSKAREALDAIDVLNCGEQNSDDAESPQSDNEDEPDEIKSPSSRAGRSRSKVVDEVEFDLPDIIKKSSAGEYFAAIDDANYRAQIGALATAENILEALEAGLMLKRCTGRAS